MNDITKMNEAQKAEFLAAILGSGGASFAQLSPIAAQTSRHARRTGGLSIVSRVAGNFSAGTATLTAGTNNSTRIAHTNLTGQALVAVAPVYVHYGPSGSTESQTPIDWQIRSALEPKGTPSDQTKIVRISAAGRRTFQLDRRSHIICEPLSVDIAPGAVFFERCEYSSASGSGAIGRHQIARGGSSGWGKDTGEGSDASQSRADSGTISTNTSAGYSASAMLGRTASGAIAPSIFILGDSKSVGSHDGEYGSNAGGWANRACAPYPGGNSAIAGEKLNQAVLDVNFMVRSMLVSYATHILCAYLTNDVLAGDSIATMKANVLAFAKKFMGRGQNFIQATVLPLTDSTNGWKNVAGQSTRTNEANRTGINAWIRDTSSTGFVAQANAQVSDNLDAGWADFIDPCLGIEVNSSNTLTLDGGFILGQVGATVVTGTASAGAVSSITDSSKSFTATSPSEPGLVGNVVYLTGGTGAGQVAAITSNTATVISVTPNFATAPDSTTTYDVRDTNSVDGNHESTGGHKRAALAVSAKLSILMARD